MLWCLYFLSILSKFPAEIQRQKVLYQARNQKLYSLRISAWTPNFSARGLKLLSHPVCTHRISRIICGDVYKESKKNISRWILGAWEGRGLGEYPEIGQHEIFMTSTIAIGKKPTLMRWIPRKEIHWMVTRERCA